MKPVATNPTVKIPAADTPETPPVVIPMTRAEELAKLAESEANAFAQKVLAILREGSELGNLALNVLARNLGESANKSGKPSESAYVAFVTAMSHRKADYGRRAELARIANLAVPEGHKPVAVIRAKASAAQGQASYRFNAPVAIDIALGE